MVGSTKFKNTKTITKLRSYRNNYMNNYLHKASRQVINLAIKHKCKEIVIGDITNIKQNMDYGKTFVQVPIESYAKLIEYKAQLEGIKVIYQKESYTSGCSSIDLDGINKKNYNKSRRIYRGLFKSNTGILINADVNGSLNILRLYIKDKCIPKLIKKARDKGYVNSPVKQRVA